MAKVFLSHSSKDKEFARRLFEDLKSNGHEPWIDEEQIKVGDSIPDKIEHGLNDCEYIIVILSQNAVSSNWVDREWKPKYFEEVETSKVKVLPILLEPCEVPKLISDKKWADFSSDYKSGLSTLLKVFESKDNPVKEDNPIKSDFSANLTSDPITIEKVELNFQHSYFFGGQPKFLQRRIKVIFTNNSNKSIPGCKIEVSLPKHSLAPHDTYSLNLDELNNREKDSLIVYSKVVDQQIYPTETVGIDIGDIRIHSNNIDHFYKVGIPIKIYTEVGIIDKVIEIKDQIGEKHRHFKPEDFLNN